MKTAISLLLLVISMASNAQNVTGSASDVEKQLVRTWNVESMAMAGQKIAVAEFMSIEITFKPDHTYHVIATAGGETKDENGKWTFDAAKKNISMVADKSNMVITTLSETSLSIVEAARENVQPQMPAGSELLFIPKK